MDYKTLPVYAQKERILAALKNSQVVVVQSPTGSGKTTQIPVILHEAGYDKNGIIAVTQPRRIATLSVSQFIAEQLGTKYPGLVGYKMRFEDETDETTKIKIMTDGILLQEMKLDPLLMKYCVLMVDEAHERSLNIDFVLGLLKRILVERPDFKVIVSSATLNTQVFSEYFGGAPIVTIDTVTYPVTTIFDPPKIAASTMSAGSRDELMEKISDITERVVTDDSDDGAILIFLPGERSIKDCIEKLSTSSFSSKIFLLPLYSRLSKEEQERVFFPPPKGKKKIIIATNIAETSVTIADVTTVIDSGLAKLSYYDNKTFTTSLIETKVARASCDQRRGRAGRVRAGTCYRLYNRKDFEKRDIFTTEEIFRTDLSDVVLQMADLGINDFEGFDFISQPGKKGILGAVKTLRMLDALDKDNGLTNIGRLMTKFPVEPRISRILSEAINSYPAVIDECLVAAAFLSTNSPFVLPQGEELQAREAHHTFNDKDGDFVSYLKLFREFDKFFNEYGSYSQMALDQYCNKHYLDCRVMLEIRNVKEQLGEIITAMNIPISSGGATEDYLTCIAKGMVQFVAVKAGHEHYKTLTQDKIYIHPASCMCRVNPPYIVAGEIIETSRTFASSVSPITKAVIERVAGDYKDYFQPVESSGEYKNKFDRDRPYVGRAPSLKAQGRGSGTFDNRNENSIIVAGKTFEIIKDKGMKIVTFTIDSLVALTQLYSYEEVDRFGISNKIKGKIIYPNGGSALTGESVNAILRIAKKIDLRLSSEARTFLSMTKGRSDATLDSAQKASKLMLVVQNLLKVVAVKKKGKELGFLTLYTDDGTSFWVKGCRNFYTALKETLSTFETLAGKEKLFTLEQQQKINSMYSLMTDLLRT